MYKREDFEVKEDEREENTRYFVTLKKDSNSWLIPDGSINGDIPARDYFYFPSEQEAEEAITKFLAKQNGATIKNDLAVLFATMKKQSKGIKESITEFNKALTEAEKISKVCFEKPEKVFSLVKWITCWKNNPEYISQAILDGWVTRCEGKTANEIVKNESASIADDCFVYPEELNKEK